MSTRTERDVPILILNLIFNGRSLFTFLCFPFKENRLSFLYFLCNFTFFVNQNEKKNHKKRHVRGAFLKIQTADAAVCEQVKCLAQGHIISRISRPFHSVSRHMFLSGGLQVPEVNNRGEKMESAILLGDELLL